jgi:hypothetical protein
MRRLGVLALSLFVAACDKPPGERFKPVLNVHCLLISHGTRTNSWVDVVVDRTYAVGETTRYVDLDSVSVLLWRNSSWWPVDFTPPNWYGRCQSMHTCAILPGDTFRLQVSALGFDTVFGRTVVPDSFAVTAPRDSAFVHVADSIVWTRSPGCKGYFFSYARAGWDEAPWFEFSVPNDSLAGRLPMFFFTGQYYWDFLLYVMALDSNYYDWARGTIDKVEPDPQQSESHLAGGVGVFGSAYACSLHVVVIPESVK